MAALFGNKSRLTRKQADALVMEYYDEIYIFTYKQTFDKELAMDLTQEIFINVLRAYEGYDEKKASLRTWIYRIATNKIIDYRRSRAAGERLHLPLDEVREEVQSGPEYIAESRDLLQKTEEFISRYDAATQQIFRLHVFSELSFAAIAQLTDSNESSVKSIYYRLIKQIRKELGDEF